MGKKTTLVYNLKMNKRDFFQSGLSLLEITIALGISSVISLGFMSTMKNQSENLRGIKDKVEESLLIGEIASVMKNEDGCSNTLVNNPSGVIQLGDNITTIYDKKDRLVFDMADEDTITREQVFIDSMTLRNIDVPNTAPDIGGNGRAELVITTKRKGEAGKDNETDRIYRIKLQVEASDTLEIISCFAVQDIGEVNSAVLEDTCLLMGGTYDSGTGNCTLNCDLASPSHLSAMSVECALNSGKTNYIDPVYVNTDMPETLTGDIDITGHLTTSNGISGLVFNATAIEGATVIGDGTSSINVGGVGVLTTNLLYSNLTESEKETVLANVISTTTDQTGINAIIDQSKQSIGTTAVTCGAGEAISGLGYNSSTGQFTFTCSSTGTGCPPASHFCSGTTYNSIDGFCTVAGTKNCCPPASQVCTGESFVDPSLGCNVVGTRACVIRTNQDFSQSRSLYAIPVSCTPSLYASGSWSSWSPSCASLCTNGTFVSAGISSCSYTAKVGSTCATAPTGCVAQTRSVTCECDP